MSLLASSAFHKTLDYEHNSAEFFSFYNIDCLFSNMLLISIWHLIRMAFDSLFLPTRSSWFSKKMELFSLALLSLWALTRISLPVEIPPCTSQLLQSPHLTHFQSHFHRVSFLLQQHHLLPSAPPHPPGKVPLTRWGFHTSLCSSFSPQMKKLLIYHRKSHSQEIALVLLLSNLKYDSTFILILLGWIFAPVGLIVPPPLFSPS